MTGETRVSLVVGLLFIILFGLIISRLTENKPSTGTKGNPAVSRTPSDEGLRTGTAKDLPTPPLPGDTRLPTPAPESSAPRAVTPRAVTPPPPAAPAAPAAASTSEVRKHVVKPGETLSRIAGAYYGAGNAARGVEAILKANSDRVAGAKNLRVNTELTIPAMP